MKTYTVYFYPFQQPWIAQNLTFLQTPLATWQGEWFALVQPLNALEYAEVYEAVEAGRVLGVKPGSHPSGNPIGK